MCCDTDIVSAKAQSGADGMKSGKSILDADPWIVSAHYFLQYTTLALPNSRFLCLRNHQGDLFFFPVSTKTLKIFPFFLSSKNISQSTSFLTSITISPSIYSSFHSARVRGKGKRRSTAARAFKKRSNESEFIKDRYKYGSLAGSVLPPASTQRNRR